VLRSFVERVARPSCKSASDLHGNSGCGFDTGSGSDLGAGPGSITGSGSGSSASIVRGVRPLAGVPSVLTPRWTYIVPARSTAAGLCSHFLTSSCVSCSCPNSPLLLTAQWFSNIFIRKFVSPRLKPLGMPGALDRGHPHFWSENTRCS
jgi:hypothetical protein